eukprot:Phypoly_transcript_22346.p1 GENE.Phypoly_transcript_22346~~Phypoly_transcript_22346.p1  ORF type:complete len:164 (-),score=4.34 Phypoly_transcript_22346:67-558(-)
MGKTYYFPHTVTYTSEFAINDWARIPSNLHHTFYATMVAYHDAEIQVGSRSLNFHLPKDDGVHAFKVRVLGIGLFTFAVSMGLAVFVGWCFWSYSLAQYCIGLCFCTLDVILFGTAVCLFHQCKMDRVISAKYHDARTYLQVFLSCIFADECSLEIGIGGYGK